MGDLLKSFITLTELLLLTIDDAIAYIKSGGNDSSLNEMNANADGSSGIPFLRLPTPVSALNKCVEKVIQNISAMHMKVAMTSINLLRRNNILHTWILPLPVPCLTVGGLHKEQKFREERLERLVDILRSNRKSHWSAEVRESCELFLDDLLDHLSG